MSDVTVDQLYLVRPCRSTYMDRGGMRRRLKPNIAHGAWIIGPSTRESLSYQRKYTDLEVSADEMPAALVAWLEDRVNSRSTFISAADLSELGWPVPEIPSSGLRRWWWLFLNDAGGAR